MGTVYSVAKRHCFFCIALIKINATVAFIYKIICISVIGKPGLIIKIWLMIFTSYKSIAFLIVIYADSFCGLLFIFAA